MELTIWSSGFCLRLYFRNTFKVKKQQQPYEFFLFLTPPPLTQAQMCKDSVFTGLEVSIYKKLLEFLMCTQSRESLIKRRHWIHVVTRWWPVTIKSTCVTMGVWNIMDKHLSRCFRIYRVKVAGLLEFFILRVTSSYKNHLIIAWLKRSGVRQLDRDNVQVFSEKSLLGICMYLLHSDNSRRKFSKAYSYQDKKR